MGDYPGINLKMSVKGFSCTNLDAAKVMKSYHSTAVLVTGTPDGDDKMGGIFTTKDIVLRVIAASLDPNSIVFD